MSVCENSPASLESVVLPSRLIDSVPCLFPSRPDLIFPSRHCPAVHCSPPAPRTAGLQSGHYTDAITPCSTRRYWLKK